MFITQNLSYRPDNLGEYSLDSVLESGDAGHLGLFLVRTYAQNISLTTRGPARRLCISLARKPDDGGIAPVVGPGGQAWLRGSPWPAWSTRESWCAAWTTQTAASHSSCGPLAHQILSLVDGNTDFGAIMAKTLKVMPEKRAHQVEDLFEVLIQKGLVQGDGKSLWSRPR